MHAPTGWRCHKKREGLVQSSVTSQPPRSTAFYFKAGIYSPL